MKTSQTGAPVCTGAFCCAERKVSDYGERKSSILDN
nr:MAG TPA: hypothetical protein [Caudoviricetes sp.]